MEEIAQVNALELAHHLVLAHAEREVADALIVVLVFAVEDVVHLVLIIVLVHVEVAVDAAEIVDKY